MKRTVRRLLARAVASLPTGILCGTEHADIFQRAGIHITADHFYQPIPNTDHINAEIWDKPSSLPGIHCNTDEQLTFFGEILANGYVGEYQQLPLRATSPGEYSRLGPFGGIDGAILYATIRWSRPAKIVEIGAGQSTLLSALAINANGNDGQLTSIDPYPQSYLTQRNVGCRFNIIEEKAERVPLSVFEALEPNDILFIDSSHVVKIDGDVLYEILDILPRLKPGVLIHIHDIFLPCPYPREWVLTKRMFWTEQYLVQAFLAFNKSFEIFWSSAMMDKWHRDRLLLHFSELELSNVNSSLWLRRVS